MRTEKILKNTIFTALILLSLFVFVSISISAGFHILIILPGFYLTYQSLKNKSIKWSKSAICLAAVIIWSAITVFGNSDIIANPFSNLSKLKYLLIGLLSIPCFQFFIERDIDQKKSKLLLKMFVISTTIATISGLIAYYSGFNPLKFKPACHDTRTCGMYGMYMTYGYGIGLFLTLLTGLVLRPKFQLINKKILYGSFAINLVSFLLSFARGAYIGYFASVPMFFFKRKRKLFTRSLLALSICGILSIAFIPKIKSLVFDASRIQSIKLRLSNYKASIYAAKEKPILGYGYKNFEINSKIIKKRNNIEFPNFQGHGHSNFFEHLGSTGYIGLILVLFFHIFWIRETYLRDDLIGWLTFPFTINFFLSGQFQYTFGDGENLFMIMAIYAISQLDTSKKALA